MRKGFWSLVGLMAICVPVTAQSLPRSSETTPYLGITVSQETDDGVTVQSVNPGSPAAQVGLKRGDTITKINGRSIRSQQDLANALSKHQSGEQLTIVAQQETGQQKEVVATLRQRPQSQLASTQAFDYSSPRWGGSERTAGCQLQEGVVVTEVTPGSPASNAGLRRGDVIIGINGISGRLFTGTDQLSQQIASGAQMDIIRSGQEITSRLGQTTTVSPLSGGMSNEIYEGQYSNSSSSLLRRVQQLEQQLQRISQQQQQQQRQF